jgi:cell cycle protein kinase DBF2
MTRKYNTQRGLNPEELEILQKPNVKRLANVTQLCEYGLVAFLDIVLIV